MIRAVRIHAFQQMPNYRKPASFLIKESYPLPPFSSVIGMVHALCGWKSYHPMDIGVQGNTAGVVNDYATNYSFGPIKYEPGRHAFGVDRADGSGGLDGVGRGPHSYELLTDVELLLHIAPKDVADVDVIVAALADPPVYPSLGRYEDLIRFDSVEAVTLHAASQTPLAYYDMYVPTAASEDALPGTIYSIGKVFAYHDIKPLPKNKKKTEAAITASKADKMREWAERCMVRCICKGTQLAQSGMTLADYFEDKEIPVYLV